MATYAGKLNIGGTDLPIGSTLYATCTTAAGTVAKVATQANFDTLVTGVTVHVKFSNSNTATNPTLNVNGTGAKAIMRYGTTRVGKTVNESWNAGAIVSFTYDGTNWVMNDWLNATYSDATTTVSGLMSATDKSKLDTLATELPTLCGFVACNFTIGSGVTLNANSGKQFTCRLPSYMDYYGVAITQIQLGTEYPVVLHSWEWRDQSFINVFIYNTSSVQKNLAGQKIYVDMLYFLKDFVTSLHGYQNPWTDTIY